MCGGAYETGGPFFAGGAASAAGLEHEKRSPFWQVAPQAPSKKKDLRKNMTPAGAANANKKL